MTGEDEALLARLDGLPLLAAAKDAAALIRAQAEEIVEWRKVTERNDPNDCAEGIAECYKPCEECDLGIRDGAPCESCGGTGKVTYKALYEATVQHIKEMRDEKEEVVIAYQAALNECKIANAHTLRLKEQIEAAARQEPVCEVDMRGQTLNWYADELFERAPQMVNSADGALAVQASQIIRWLATKLYAAPVPAATTRIELSGYGDDDERWGDTVEDYVAKASNDRDYDDLISGEPFAIHCFWERHEKWRTVSTSPIKCERVDAPVPAGDAVSVLDLVWAHRGATLLNPVAHETKEDWIAAIEAARPKP